MDVGEVRVAEDKDFDVLKIYLSRNDGWKLEYEKGSTRVWTRSPANIDGSDFKMIRMKTTFRDVPAHVLYDVLHDPEYRRHWDRYMLDIREIGHLNPNNNITYYSLSCPSPLKNRDFVLQCSWLETPKEFMILNHSVYHKDMPPKKGFVRGTSYLTGFRILPLGPDSCEMGYVTHSNPRGKLPIWVSNKVSSSFAPKLVLRLHKACLKYEAWKRDHHKAKKPWIFPEQIESPRINALDCQQVQADSEGSSPEESLAEELEACDIESFSEPE